MADGSVSRYDSEVFSIVKGLGIIMVAAGHAGYAPVAEFVYLFHMALFFFVAGYFFKDAYADAKLSYLWRRIRSLWFPLVGYGMVFLLLHNTFYRFHIYSDLYGYGGAAEHLYGAKDYLYALNAFLQCSVRVGNLLGALWFVRSLLVASLAFCLCVWGARSLCRRHTEVTLGAIVAAVCVGVTLLPEVGDAHLNVMIHRDLLLLPLLYGGRLFRRWQERIPSGAVPLLVCFGLLLLAQAAGVRIGLNESDFGGNMALFYAVSFVGCYFTWLCARMLHGIGRVRGALVCVGRSTFEIMALHLLAFKAVSLLRIAIYGYSIDRLAQYPVIDAPPLWLWWIPYTVAGVVLPLGYVRLRDRTVEWWRNRQLSFDRS